MLKLKLLVENKTGGDGIKTFRVDEVAYASDSGFFMEEAGSINVVRDEGGISTLPAFRLTLIPISKYVLTLKPEIVNDFI